MPIVANAPYGKKNRVGLGRRFPAVYNDIYNWCVAVILDIPAAGDLRELRKGNHN